MIQYAQSAQISDISGPRAFDPLACDKGRTALASIFNYINDQNWTLATRVGYAFDEIFLQAIQAGPEPSLAQYVDDRISLIDVELGELQKEIRFKRPKAIPDQWSSARSVLLFDPANAPNNADVDELGANVYFIPHGLRIPVGIGFSLAMLNELALPQVRASLYKRLIAAGMPPETPGIVWNSDSLNRIADLETGFAAPAIPTGQEEGLSSENDNVGVQEHY
jgi:hypothetical protein